MRRSSVRAAVLAAAASEKAVPSAASSSASAPAGVGGLCVSREQGLRARHGVVSVGIDEAGRGPLAGPVVAAAVALLRVGAGPPLAGVRDSKDVPEEEREALFEALLRSGDIEFGVAVVERDVIDDINILQATMRGMEAAFAQVRAKLAARGAAGGVDTGHLYALVDGPKVPAGIIAAVAEHCARGAATGAAAAAAAHPHVQFAEPVIGGDAKVYSIAAASLIAKVTRDRLMRAYDTKWPAYGFAQHKGYGTSAHMAAIHAHGPCPIHRRTFRPIKDMLAAAADAAAAPAGAAAPAAAASADASGSGSGSSKRGRRAGAAAPPAAAAPAADSTTTTTTTTKRTRRR